MSVTSSRTIQVEFSGDVSSEVLTSSLVNNVSPAEYDILTLVSGPNTITPPVVSGIVITGLTIIPPSGNTSIITLKGVAGDTGIPLHLTDPSSLSLDPTFVSLVLDVASDIIGARLIWS